MNWRLQDIPVFEKKETEIPAKVYNTIRLGKIRLKKNFRLEPDGLRSLDLILEDDAWIVVDRDLNDLPVMAWTDFQVRGRDNLHLPIQCKLLYYHQHAEKIQTMVLDFAYHKIEELLKEQ